MKTAPLWVHLGDPKTTGPLTYLDRCCNDPELELSAASQCADNARKYLLCRACGHNHGFISWKCA